MKSKARRITTKLYAHTPLSGGILFLLPRVVARVFLFSLSFSFFFFRGDLVFDPLERFGTGRGFRIFGFAVDVFFGFVFVWTSVGVRRFRAVVPVPTTGFVRGFFFEHVVQRGAVDASFFQLALRLGFGLRDKMRRIVIDGMNLFGSKPNHSPRSLISGY